MRRLLIFLSFITTFGFINATDSTGKLNWKTWNEGFHTAAGVGKIALIDTYTNWCGWCKRMDATTYSDSAVLAKIEANFVPIKFNPELPGSYNVGDTLISGRALLGALSKGGRTPYPTTFFYIPTQNVMYQFQGYMDAAAFGKVLDEMVAANQLGLLPKTTEPTN